MISTVRTKSIESIAGRGQVLGKSPTRGSALVHGDPAEIATLGSFAYGLPGSSAPAGVVATPNDLVLALAQLVRDRWAAEMGGVRDDGSTLRSCR